MLFSNADIEKTIWKSLSKFTKSCAFRHGGSNRNDPVVVFSHFEQGLAKDFSICWCGNFVVFNFPCIGIKASNTMKIGGIFFSRRVSFTLLRCHMQEYGLVNTPNIVQYIDKMVQVMPVYGAKIFEVKSLKQHAGCDKGLERFFGTFCQFINIFSDSRQ